MKLVKRSDSVSKETNQLGVSRRAFMKNTSLAASGAVVGAGLFAPGMMKKAQAKSVDPEAKTEVKRTICSLVLLAKCAYFASLAALAVVNI